jgi:hypothetical protein
LHKLPLWFIPWEQKRGGSMCNFKKISALVVFGSLSSVAYAESAPETTAAPDAIATPSSKLVDPTQPIEISTNGKKSGKKSEKYRIKSLNVQIISYNQNGGSFVVINGKRFMEGDAFDETTIKKIEQNKVILSNPTRKPLVLEYANLSIKKNGGNEP